MSNPQLDKLGIKYADKLLLTPNDAAEILGISAWTVVNQYIASGKLKAHKLGGRGNGPWRIWKQDLINFIEATQ